LKHIRKDEIRLHFVFDVASLAFQLNSCLLIQDYLRLDDPKFLRFEVLDLEIAINNKSQSWDLTGTVAEDRVVLQLEPLTEGHGLVSGKGTAHSEVDFYSIVDSISLKLVGNSQILIGLNYILPCYCRKPRSFDFDGWIDSLDDLQNFKSDGFAFSIAIQPENQLLLPSGKGLEIAEEILHSLTCLANDGYIACEYLPVIEGIPTLALWWKFIIEEVSPD
jgi:hypothetical protein